MICPATGTRIFLACGHSDMCRGMDGLAALVQQAFGQDPFCGAVYLFRGKRGRLIKRVGVTARVSAFLPSALNADTFSGR